MIGYCAHQRLTKDCLECYIKKSDNLFHELIIRLEHLEDKVDALDKNKHTLTLKKKCEKKS